MRVKFYVQNIFSIVIFILSFMFLECGIKNIIALSPADIASNDLEKWVRIKHSKKNKSQSFKGYNVYYKFYQEDNTSSVNFDRDYLTDSIRVPSESSLTSRKFKLLQKFDKEDSENPLENPHIKIDSQQLTKSHTVYIDFSAGKTIYKPLRDEINKEIENAKYLSSDGEYYNMLFIRYDNAKEKKIEYLKRNTKKPKSFFESKDGSSPYSKKDDDIKNMIGANFTRQDNKKLLIVFAVIPYGIDFTEAKISYGPIVVTDPLELEYRNSP